MESTRSGAPSVASSCNRLLTSKQGQHGYWITAYRTLTSVRQDDSDTEIEPNADVAIQQMIQDLKLDSQRWQQERQPGETGRGGSHSPHLRDTKVSRGPNASLVAYQDSRTHAARQHWGPTKPYEEPPRQASSASSRTYPSSAGSYGSSDANYTHVPSAPYGSYQPAPAVSAPRTAPADPYYPQSGGRDSREYQTQPVYPSYSTQAPTDPYGRPTAPPTAIHPAARYFGYFDERYLVYR